MSPRKTFAPKKNTSPILVPQFSWKSFSHDVISHCPAHVVHHDCFFFVVGTDATIFDELLLGQGHDCFSNFNQKMVIVHTVKVDRKRMVRVALRGGAQEELKRARQRSCGMDKFEQTIIRGLINKKVGPIRMHVHACSRRCDPRHHQLFITRTQTQIHGPWRPIGKRAILLGDKEDIQGEPATKPTTSSSTVIEPDLHCANAMRAWKHKSRRTK